MQNSGVRTSDSWLLTADSTLLGGTGNLFMPKAGDFVVVDHSDGLHKGIADGWADEPEAALFKIFAHGFGFGACDGEVTRGLAAVLDRTIADETPEVIGKGAELFLDGQYRSGVSHRRIHFQDIADNSGVQEQASNALCVVVGHLGGIKIIERGAIRGAFFEDG